VPAARRYSGETLNRMASAAAFDGLRSEVSSVKTGEPFWPSPNGTLSQPYRLYAGNCRNRVDHALCITGTLSPL